MLLGRSYVGYIVPHLTTALFNPVEHHLHTEPITSLAKPNMAVHLHTKTWEGSTERNALMEWKESVFMYLKPCVLFVVHTCKYTCKHVHALNTLAATPGLPFIAVA